MAVGPDSHVEQAAREPLQGTQLLAEQNRRHNALRGLLREWAEETGPPDPKEVAAMRHRYFTQ